MKQYSNIPAYSRQAKDWKSLVSTLNDNIVTKSFFKTFFFLIITFGNVEIGVSQSLHAISIRASDLMDYLSKVDPMTGSTIIISTAGLAKAVSMASTIDPVNKRFFFTSLGDTLYTVDLATGNLLTKNVSSLSGTYSNMLFEFNSQDTTLYAISIKASDGMDYLSKVDPMTGTTTIISTAGLAKAVSMASTIDPINKRFFFTSMGDTLYTVDLATGNLLAKNVSSLSGTYSNMLFEFNCQDTTLYAISIKASDGMDYLSKVDPMTGTTTIISTAGLAKAVSMASTIDPVNKRFFFTSIGDTLNTVDLATGSLLAKNVSSLSGAYSNILFEFEKTCLSISPTTEIEIELPSIFSPNNDGINDNFTPIKYKGITKSTLKIFNRWGEKIFYTDHILQGWNGYYKESICSSGPYYWIVQYTTITNESKEIKGFLTLIK